jgi:Ca-activated chloride channel homolog
LKDALDNLFIEGGPTALIDAVYLSVEKLVEHKKGVGNSRRALILITDGHDTNSYYNQDQLFAKLRENPVQVFIIGIVHGPSGFIKLNKKEQDSAVQLLNRLAQETGGRVFYPKSVSELPSIASTIARELQARE